MKVKRLARWSQLPSEFHELLIVVIIVKTSRHLLHSHTVKQVASWRATITLCDHLLLYCV